MSEVQETVLQIDLKALEHNYRYLRAQLRPQTRFMAVVKAFAYGSEAVAISSRLEALGADYLAVAYTPEGISLRKAGIRLPILVLHPQPAYFQELIRYQLEPSLYSRRVFEAFHEAAVNSGQHEYPVQLKFNSGLNRLGFGSEDIPWLSKETLKDNALKVKAVFSHLAASEDASEDAFTHLQLERFREMSNGLEQALGYSPLRHQLNTSGILRHADEAQYDMVRSGIGLYGFGNEDRYDRQLKPVARLKSLISQIHDLRVGESVGYNRSFMVEKPMRSATIPLGHADGLGRIYGKGRGWITIKGQRAPIVGNVCMDMVMVDVTGIDCSEGDEVEIFGEQTSAHELATAAGTISYELITGISQRVKRQILE